MSGMGWEREMLAVNLRRMMGAHLAAQKGGKFGAQI